MDARAQVVPLDSHRDDARCPLAVSPAFRLPNPQLFLTFAVSVGASAVTGEIFREANDDTASLGASPTFRLGLSWSLSQTLMVSSLIDCGARVYTGRPSRPTAVVGKAELGTRELRGRSSRFIIGRSSSVQNINDRSTGRQIRRMAHGRRKNPRTGYHSNTSRGYCAR